MEGERAQGRQRQRRAAWPWALMKKSRRSPKPSLLELRPRAALAPLGWVVSPPHPSLGWKARNPDSYPPGLQWGPALHSLVLGPYHPGVEQ